ncbi:unnamed protein product [Bathycoccus prasinos]
MGAAESSTSSRPPGTMLLAKEQPAKSKRTNRGPKRKCVLLFDDDDENDASHSSTLLLNRKDVLRLVWNLPKRLRLTWRKLFDTNTDGLSFTRLLESLTKNEATSFCIAVETKEKKGEIFGALMVFPEREGLTLNKTEWQGLSESYLFTFPQKQANVKRQPKKFLASANTDVASEAIEKLKTSNENELRETFQKTTERVVSTQSEAESAAMDELKIQEERMRKAEENLRAIAEETKRLREEGEGKGGENEEEKRERKDRDRIESAKVGTVSAIGGVLLSLPLALSQFSGNAFNQFADVGATALSCALFGIVYRYAVRENIDDFQLKGGVVGAFGLVRGVGQAEVFMDVASNNDELSFAAFAQAAAICGESVLVFLFAGLCVEAAMTREFILRKSGKE